MQFIMTEFLPAIFVLKIMRKLPPRDVGNRDNTDNESLLHGNTNNSDNMLMASPTQLYVPLPQHPLYSNLWAVPQGESPLYECGITGYNPAPLEAETPGSAGSSYVQVVVERRDVDAVDEEEDDESHVPHSAHSMVVEQHQFDLRSSAVTY